MIAIVAAVARNNIIGKANALPWYIPEDLKRFKNLTTGHVVLMGNKTYESIVDRLGKPLPNRTNVVLSKNPGYQVLPGVVLYDNLQEALNAYQDQDLYIIGGGSIFRQTLDLADRLYITHIHKEVEGDVLFPPIDKNTWKKIEDEEHEGYSFALYARRVEKDSGEDLFFGQNPI